MSNDIVPFNVTELPAVAEERFSPAEQVSGKGFLPRMQLVTKGKYVDTGKIGAGRWGAPQGDEVIDLGETVDVLPLAIRNKALDVSDRDNIVTNYDLNSDEFKRIKSAPKNSGCMWGLSYLVIARKTQTMYELFFGNASGRAEGDKLKPFLPRKDRQPSAATLRIKYRQTAEYGYHVPVIVKCSDPIEVTLDMAVVLKEIEKFNNPAAGPEVVEDDTPARAR